MEHFQIIEFGLRVERQTRSDDLPFPERQISVVDVSPEFLGKLYEPGEIKGDLKLMRFRT
jgi:hypothetical protein